MKRPTEKQEEYEWIERYLTNQMPAGERAELETEMQTDPIFKQEVLLLQRTQKLMEEAFLEQRATSTVKFLQRQSRRKMQRIRLVSRSLVGLASAGLLLVLYLSASPVVFPNSENDINVTRNLSDDSSTVATPPNQIFSQFFEGQSHLSEGQYALAAKNFQQVLTASDIRPYFREAAQWHLAFAYLKSGEPDKAERMYNQFRQCIDCEYPIRTIDRWKIWWQIKWAQWLG
jgi:tetratricopeptide (TPR) repeat protein